MHVHHGADRPRGEELAPRPAGADLVITTYAWPPGTRRRSAGSGWHRVVLRRGAEHQERARPGRREAVRSLPAGSPDRAHRHPGGEPAGRPVVDHGVHQPGPARARPRSSGSATPSRSSGTATTRRPRRLRPDHRPVHPAPAQDRPVDHLRPAGQAGDEGLVQPHRRAGLALPGGGRPTCWPGSRPAEGIERRGLVLATMAKLKQVCNHPAQSARRRLAGCPAGPASWPGWRRSATRSSAGGEGAAASPSTPSSARMLQPHLAARLGCEVLFLHGGTPQEAARRDGGPVPAARTRAAAVPALAQGRRHRAEPHRRQPRGPRRPVVEPGRGGPGHRPGVPHRPAPRRPGPQVRLRRHGGGEDRRHDRGEAGPGRTDRRHRRELAHRAVRRPSCASCSRWSRRRWSE